VCVPLHWWDQERFGPPSPPGNFISDVQAAWQTPAVSIFAHMRAASFARRDGLLAAAAAANDQAERSSKNDGLPGAKAPVGTGRARALGYHCAIWTLCVFFSVSLSILNFVVFGSSSNEVLTEESGMRVRWRGLELLQVVNALALFGPFLATVMYGVGVVVHAWLAQRRLNRRVLRAQPYHVAPTGGRLPLMIVMLFLAVWTVPTAKRLAGLVVAPAAEAGKEEAAHWSGLANLVWAISLGGQGVGTALVWVAAWAARRADASTAVQAQGDA
jgi:hypothetical protein